MRINSRRPPGADTPLFVGAAIMLFRPLKRAGDVFTFRQPQSRDCGYRMPPADAGWRRFDAFHTQASPNSFVTACPGAPWLREDSAPRFRCASSWAPSKMQVKGVDAGAGARRTAGLHPIEHKSLAGDPDVRTGATAGPPFSCLVVVCALAMGGYTGYANQREDT
jgi:hypothetical protein